MYSSSKLIEPLPHLFIGFHNPPDQQFSMIINCTVDIPFQSNSNLFIRLPIRNFEQTMQHTFYNCLQRSKVIDEIHYNLLRNQSVFIYSHNACLIIACYLIKCYKMTPVEATKYLQKKLSLDDDYFIHVMDILERVYTSLP